MTTSLDTIKERALHGIGASATEALALNESCTTDNLCAAADEVRARHQGNIFDTCSIVNARSGRCPEDCKWCAQSRHHNTGVAEYDIIPEDDFLKAVKLNESHGVRRFSMVTSGRRITPEQIGRFCSLYRKGRTESGNKISFCASMGLLGREELQALKDAGVMRYHCNLETSPNYFPRLCSTHTYADKLRTIREAREVGLEVCSGGIIGMGESMLDRLQLAQQARDAGAVSIPVNILQPIKGTPLADTPLISEEEVTRTIALFKLIAPKCVIRFAGGRARLSKKTMARTMRGGINGAIVGDLLTTIGNTLAEDRAMLAATGFTEE